MENTDWKSFTVKCWKEYLGLTNEKQQEREKTEWLVPQFILFGKYWDDKTKKNKISEVCTHKQ
jgi:thiamine monophosphate synthase